MSRSTEGRDVAERKAHTPLLTSLGRLLRLSLTVSAVADIAAGVILGAGTWPAGPRPFLLVLASLGVYHGGMALNDWADRAHDARTRPERPLPSGAIAPGLALALGLGLLVLGPLVALQLDPGAGRLLAAVAAFAFLYDVAGRGPWLGPLLLGLCRAGNLAAGLRLGLALAAPDRVPGGVLFDVLTLWGAPVLYGAYVFAISRLGRLEDGEDRRPLGRRPARWLAVAAGVLIGAPIVPLPAVPIPSDFVLASDGSRLTAAALLAAVGAFPLLRGAFRPTEWTRARVQSWMGVALRRLLFFTATLSLARGTFDGMCVAAIILAGFPVSHALRRVFPPS